MIREAEAHGDEAHKLRELADARNNAESLAYQIEKSLNENREKLDALRRRDGRGADHGAARRARVERRRARSRRRPTRCRRRGRRRPRRSTRRRRPSSAVRNGGVGRRPTTRWSRTPSTRSSTSDATCPEEEQVEVESRRTRLARRVTKERDEYLDALQRLKAEFDNYRKRVARDQQRAGRARLRAARDASSCRCSTTSSGRSRSATAHEEAKLEDGVRLVHRALADALAKEGLAEIETDGKFDPHTQEALLSQPSEAEEGTVIQVLQKGYRSATACCGRRGWSSRRGHRLPKSLYEIARRLQERVAGRAQEGVPQARPRGAPRPEPGQRGALQGGAGRLRRALRPGEAQAVRPLRLDERPAGAGGAGTTFDFGDFDLGDIFGGLFSRGGAAAAAAARPARQRRRGRGARLVRGRAAGRADDGAGAARARLPHLPRHRRGAGHGAEAAARSATAGRRRDVAGPVRAAAAVPALPRHGHDRRDAVPDVPRRRPRAAHEALHGEDPGRASRTARGSS